MINLPPAWTDARSNSRSIIAHCRRTAINIRAWMRVSTHSSWKRECSLPGAACCSVCALFATMGSRLQTGDLSEFVRVRCILTMQFHHRDDETSRDYVVVIAISAKMRLGPRFSHRAKAALNELLDIPRVCIANEYSTAWHISFFSDSDLLFKKKRERESKNRHMKIRD